MRTLTISTLATLLLTACSATLGPSPEISDRVVVLEPGTELTVEPGRLILRASSAPTLASGDIVVSGDGAGLLRRVVSIEEAGDRVVVATEPAALTDAILRGELSNQIAFSGRKEPDDSARAVRFEGFAVGLGGTTLVANPNVSIDVTEGHFNFDPDLELDLDLDGASLERFEAVASGTVDTSFTARVTVSGDAGGHYEKELWSTERTFVQFIGYVPVVETVELELGVGVAVEGEGTGVVEIGGASIARIAAGARYEDGAWKGIGEHEVSLEPHARVIEGDGELAVSGFVFAELKIKLYDVAGPAISLRPYVGLRHELGEPGWTPSVGLEGVFEGVFELPVVDEGWVGFEAQLFDVSRDFAPIFAGATPEEPPTEACGDITYYGDCTDGAAVWCDGGALRRVDCAASGLGCGWVDDTTGYYCVDGCGELDYFGACADANLRWCEDGEVRTYDCGSAGSSCGWQDETVGYNCE